MRSASCFAASRTSSNDTPARCFPNEPYSYSMNVPLLWRLGVLYQSVIWFLSTLSQGTRSGGTETTNQAFPVCRSAMPFRPRCRTDNGILIFPCVCYEGLLYESSSCACRWFFFLPFFFHSWPAAIMRLKLIPLIFLSGLSCQIVSAATTTQRCSSIASSATSSASLSGSSTATGSSSAASA